MIDLNDRRLADELVREMDRRINAATFRRWIEVHYGTVDSIDSATRKASVFLLGSGQASPGFAYGETIPEPGDLVAAFTTSDGGRFILRILSRDVTGGGSGSRVFAFFVSG